MRKQSLHVDTVLGHGENSGGQRRGPIGQPRHWRPRSRGPGTEDRVHCGPGMEDRVHCGHIVQLILKLIRYFLIIMFYVTFRKSKGTLGY